MHCSACKRPFVSHCLFLCTCADNCNHVLYWNCLWLSKGSPYYSVCCYDPPLIFTSPAHVPHGTGQPTSTSPYVITVSASTGYTPGKTYSVTISKNNTGDPNFKGFLCQIRQVGQTVAIGTFSVRDTSKSKTIDCSRSKVS
jgi:hypothetical protein